MRFILLFLFIIPLGLKAQGVFIVGDGVQLNMSNSTALTLVEYDMVNNGQVFSEDSEITIINTTNSSISGKGNYFLSKLSISASDFEIASDLYIQNQLEILRGQIDIGNSVIELSLEQGEIIGENLSHFIFSTGSGALVKTFLFDSPFLLNPGNLGLEISSEESLGYGEVIRKHEALPLREGNSIKRSYEVRTDTDRDQPLDVKLYYRMQESPSPLAEPTLWAKDAKNSQPIFTTSFGENSEKGNYVIGQVSSVFTLFSVGESSNINYNDDTPTAFTPDGDGVNDTFYIPFLESLETAHVMIFNRWGEKIYESSNYLTEPWDGTWKGKSLDANTFYYKVRVPEQKTVEGKISIIK